MSDSRRIPHAFITSGPRLDPQLIGAEPVAICAWEPWMQHAACLDVDPELFYPEKGDAGRTRAAKRICAQCPVRTDCLQYAVAKHEHHGVWGGLSPKERAQLRRTAHA